MGAKEVGNFLNRWVLANMSWLEEYATLCLCLHGQMLLAMALKKGTWP
jgi:hypothetical protein